MTQIIYSWLVKIGEYSGCHQMPSRSFNIKGYQFPVCARCTGVFIGNLIAILGVFVCIPHWKYLVYGCGVMFIDWLFQYLKILKSTNIRRLTTGILGGYSLTSLYIAVILFALKAVKII